MLKKILAPAVAVALLALTLTAFSSCSPHAVLTVAPDGSGTAAFDAEMSATAEKVVRRFTGAESGLYDRNEITVSLAHAGIKVDSVRFPTPAGISLRCSLLKLDGLLGRSVTYAPSARKISVALSKESIHAAVATMPESTRDYLDLLMAPVFTGETLSRAEYLEVIGAAYGKTLEDELAASEFVLRVRCPSAVKSAKIDAPGASSAEGCDAVYRIPLSALLTMEAPLSAQTEW